MSMPDPLLQALGMPDSAGETASPADGIEGDRAALERLADPMRMMKLFAVAFQTGSRTRSNYMTGFEGYLNNVSGSVAALVAINQELDAALDVAGHVLPIATLASGAAAAATVEVPETTSLPEPVPSQHRLPWKQCQPPQRFLLNPQVFLCQRQPSLNRPQRRPRTRRSAPRQYRRSSRCRSDGGRRTDHQRRE